jgi:DNA-binding LytR/AlgR family response regulator
MKADKKMHKVELNSILYLQAIGDYVKVVSENGHLIVHDTFGRIKNSLPVSMFIQIHRSYIVSHSKIKYIEGNMIAVGNEILPIGQAYKPEFLNYLKNSGN